MNSISEIWNGILRLLKEDGISDTALETWFSSAELVDLDNNSAVICAANTLAKNVITNRFDSQIKKALNELFCQEFHVIVLDGKLEREQYIARKEGTEGFKALTVKACSFDRFIVDESNKFAYMVSTAVAENPSDATLNPIFIYGPAGTGKTHLLSSIALSIHEKYPGKKIVPISGDEFTNRLIKSIQNHTTEQFREQFRSADVLLLDNIQFIVGKNATQEEFYNTFNALYDAGKLVIMASDVPPREMQVLENRMRTRFESGVMVELKTPEQSLRRKYIDFKNNDLSLGLDSEEMDYIASKPFKSIRQIEGLMKSLFAHKRLIGILGKNDIDDVLSRSIFESENKISENDIINSCALYYNVSVNDIKGRSRSRNIAVPRQIAMYLMRMELDMSLEEIGKVFDRDHATVINSVHKISELSHTDESIMKAISYIKKKISGRVA